MYSPGFFSKPLGLVVIGAGVGSAFGNFTSLVSPFDGVTSEVLAGASHFGDFSTNTGGYIGKTWTTGKRFGQATVWSSNNSGYSASSATLNVRGKNGVPAAYNDGTIIGTVNISPDVVEPAGHIVPSSDKVTTYSNWWVEFIRVSAGATWLPCAEILFYEWA